MVKGPLSTVEIIGWAPGLGLGSLPGSPAAAGLPQPPANPDLLSQERLRLLRRRPARPLGGQARQQGRRAAVVRLRHDAHLVDHPLLHQLDGRRRLSCGSSRTRRASSTSTATRSGSARRSPGKRREGDLNIVDLEVWCENQRGEVATPGTASVLLPSRERGPVQLPVPRRRAHAHENGVRRRYAGVASGSAPRRGIRHGLRVLARRRGVPASGAGASWRRR